LDLATLFEEAFAEYEARVIAPRVAAAGESCANGRLAIETVLGYQRQRQLLGMTTDDLPTDLMKTASHVCVQEEYEICRDDHIIHRMIPVILGMERQRQLLGVDDPAETAFGEEMAQRCLSFEVELESEATLKSQGVEIVSVMESTIKLQYEPDGIVIRGSAPLKNTDYEMDVPSPCSTSGHRSGSTVEVMSLTWEVQGTGGDQVGSIKDYTLTWEPEQTHESATLSCPRTRPTEVETGLWSLLFPILHQDEIEAPGATRAMTLAQGERPRGFQLPDIQPVEQTGPFRTTGWTVAQDEHLGEKEWSKSGRGGEIKEEGSFNLHHKPR
jgi:hypothetical protein